MQQVTLQDDCQGQWCCEHRHVHPVSPTNSHPDQTHSSASPSPQGHSPKSFHRAPRLLRPKHGHLGLEGVPSRAPWLTHISVFTCSRLLWRNPPPGARRQVLFLRPEELSALSLFLSPLNHSLARGLYFTLSGDYWKIVKASF